jgi:hypothetical protein
LVRKFGSAPRQRAELRDCFVTDVQAARARSRHYDAARYAVDAVVMPPGSVVSDRFTAARCPAFEPNQLSNCFAVVEEIHTATVYDWQKFRVDV